MIKLNKKEIENLLPHRDPMLLIDELHDIKKLTSATGVVNVKKDSFFVQGHFPGQPIMPGVLQVEALAQAGAILLMTEKVDDPAKSLMVFTGINNCKFRRQVVPGDQLVLEVELGNMRRNFVTMKGKATVDGQICCELEASAALVEKTGE